MAVPMFLTLAVSLPRALDCQQGVGGDGKSRIRLTRELAIGADQKGPEYEFVAISVTAATHSGSVFVSAYAGSTVEVRKYDALGRFRGSVGRTGAGPGEYRSVDGIAVVGDSVLVLYDRLNGRVSVFDTAGVYRSSYRVSGGSFWHKYFAAFTDGSIGVRARALTASPSAGSIRSFYIRHRLNGEIVDSISVPPEEEGGMAIGNAFVGPRWAFPSTTVFALLPRGGIATAITPNYRIDVVPAAGRPLTIVRDARPVPFEDGEREEWEAVARSMGAVSLPSIPRRKPLIRDLFADADGRIWVDLYTQATRRVFPAAAGSRPGLTWWEHNAYDVFDEQGGYLGRVDLAPFSKLVAVLGNRVWVSEQAENGFYVLVRYRLSPPEVR